MKFLLALLLPVLWLGSPAKADDAKTIAQRVDESWITAYNKDDAAGVAALYASDAALLPQGATDHRREQNPRVPRWVYEAESQ
jgi:hypothetical protein